MWITRFIVLQYSEGYGAYLLWLVIIMLVINVIVLSFQIAASGFYWKSSRQSKWVAPKFCEDSDLEVEDDDDDLEDHIDDDMMNPDFVLNILDEDLTPSASGKNRQIYCVNLPVLLCFGASFKGTDTFVLVSFLKGRWAGHVLFTFF